MISEHAIILSHFSNSGIVQMPGRNFPGIVMQGDSLKIIHSQLCVALNDARTRNDEEAFFEFLDFAQKLEGQLLHYEKVLTDIGMKFPYIGSIKECLVNESFN